MNDGVEHPLRAGSSVFIPGGVWHGARNTGRGVLRLLYVFAADSFSDCTTSSRAPPVDADVPRALRQARGLLQASIFRVTGSEVRRTAGITQFGRALAELNIEIVCANTPQAKGRVERAHLTLQDHRPHARLVS